MKKCPIENALLVHNSYFRYLVKCRHDYHLLEKLNRSILKNNTHCLMCMNCVARSILKNCYNNKRYIISSLAFLRITFIDYKETRAL